MCFSWGIVEMLSVLDKWWIYHLERRQRTAPRPALTYHDVIDRKPVPYPFTEIALEPRDLQMSFRLGLRFHRLESQKRTDYVACTSWSFLGTHSKGFDSASLCHHKVLLMQWSEWIIYIMKFVNITIILYVYFSYSIYIFMPH